MLPKPEWVVSTPVNALYYQAVGVAAKRGHITVYKAEAHNNALAQMAGQINATVSSNSILSQVENRSGVTEILINNIISKSEEFLEGYELMGEWEDEMNYYGYYRLSKQKFAILKDKRCQDAMLAASARIAQGEELEQKGQVADAIRHYLGALEALAQYLGESQSVADSLGMDPGRTSFQAVSRLLASLTVTSSANVVKMKKSDFVDAERITFLVTDAKKIPQNNIPVRFSYTGSYLRQDVAVTDGNGVVAGTIHQLGNSQNARFCTQIDTKTLIRQMTQSLIVRQLFGSISGSMCCVNVVVE